ncbi:MAG: DUF4230 domain-containing protein [Bacteroidaceae bacterium]|nr:DUF4230 domain-containing protein [Bacteroidaceae bacterium]
MKIKKTTIILYTLPLVILLLATVFVLHKCQSQPEEDSSTIVIAKTPVMIEDVKPIGELYLYTTVTEEFEKGSFMGSGYGSSLFGKGNGILKKRHDCVQVLRQQISFTINLDDVQYQEDSVSGIVQVTLPQVRFVQSTLHTWFKSDDEDEEAAVEYDATPLIRRVEQKIKRRYDTPANRAKATQKAKDVLTDIFSQCGITLVFKP